VTDRTLILGGGLAGLSAAYHSDADYLVLEREERVGGLCRTNWYEGFGFDLSIHILYTRHPDLAALICEELLGGRFHEQARSSWVYSHGVFTGYPFQANLHGLPVEVATECLLGLVDALNRPSLETPSNFAQWAVATFGDGIARHFFLPYNERVWATPPEEMSYGWIADRVPIPDLAEVIVGALAEPTVRHGPNATFWYPKEGGIESLARALMANLEPARVRVSTEVSSIDPTGRSVATVSGDKYGYRDLISSLPLPTLVRLIPGAPQDVLQAADQLRSNTVFTVLLGIGRADISDHHWVYFHEDDFIFHRISYPMNFSRSLVPDGCSSVMAEISHSPHRNVSGRDLVAETIDGLRRIGVLRQDDEIRVAEIVRISPAYVIYALDHESSVATILEWLEDLDVQTVGRFGEWEYFNMDAAIASGRDAARALSGRHHSEVVDLVGAERLERVGPSDRPPVASSG